MDSSGFRFWAFVLVLGFCVLTTQAKEKSCSLNLRKELRLGHPLLLESNTTEYVYPSAEKLKIPTGQIGLRVVCPGGTILIKELQTNRSEAKLECATKGKFRFAGDNATTPVFKIKDLTCSMGIQSVSRALPSEPGKEGLQRVEIGLEIVGANPNETEFLPSIKEAVLGLAHNLTVRWAHARVPQVIVARESSWLMPSYRKGVFFEGVEMNDVYDKANQKASFNNIFNNSKIVEKYFPETDDKYFVQGQLISYRDLFFSAQQDAAYVYDNVVPVWDAVGENGNWKFVDDVIRNLADLSANGLDVWSGVHQQLHLEDPEVANIKFITLTHGVEPPQFLYKYVHDSAGNKGMVFVTINNPHVKEIKAGDVICNKYSSCDFQYPEFINKTRGYTYCCRLEDFRYYASAFGLPIFPDVTPLL